MTTVRWQRLIAMTVAVVMVLAAFGPVSVGASNSAAKALPPAMQGQKISATRVGQTQGALRDMPVRLTAPALDQSKMTSGRAPIKKPVDLPYPRKVTNPNANKPSGPSPVISAAVSKKAPQPDRFNPDKRVGDPLASASLYAAWNGLNQGDNRTLFGYGFVPPDTQGDTSGDVYTYGYYVEIVNTNLAVWDYSQYNIYGGWPKTVLGPMPIFNLWSGFGGPCANTNDGDPIVLYDEQADRWLISQFALPIFDGYPPGYFASDMSECVAVSQTGDPTGAYWLYEFPAGFTGIDDDEDPSTPLVFTNPYAPWMPGIQKMPDYPKFGIWQDAYYMTVNQFDVYFTGDWAGGGLYAFDRTAMLNGLPATYLYWDPFAISNCSMGTYYTTESNPWCFVGGVLPADNDGPWATPGSPEYVAMFEDDAWSTPAYTVGDQMDIGWVSVTWPSFGLWGWYPSLSVNAFDSEVCPGYARTCIQQPGTTATVDAISDRLMYRLQYRNFGSYQAMVVNHTVDMNDPAGHAGIRWYELDNTGGGWYVGQQGDFSPDEHSRWMGSAAMDAVGNIALGYSVSSTTLYPSIRFTHHLVSDPPGTMRTEAAIWNGGGSQTASALYGSSYARWGDYSMMSIAPDGCDFVYTQEYYRGTTPLEWYTSMGNFALNSCWSGDTVSPDTTITLASYVGNTASISFIGSDFGTGVNHFECTLDGATVDNDGNPDTEYCVSPVSLTGLAEGAHHFEVRAVDNVGNIDWTPAAYDWTVTLSTDTFFSQGAYDGYVTESSETSGVGSKVNSSGKYFSVGDASKDKQVMGFLSFDTSLLPNTAIVTGVSIELPLMGYSGTNPYTTHGPLLVDIADPFFGTAVSLASEDFQSGASATNVAVCDNAPYLGWYGCSLYTGLGFVNVAGTTQFRLRFTLDDNDDGKADVVKFFSGNNSNPAYWPQLIVTYYVP